MRCSVYGKIRFGISIFLIVQLLLPPALWAGDPAIPGLYNQIINTLPALTATALPDTTTATIFKGISDFSNPADNILIVHQDESTAIIEWESFDVGEEAWTHFDQQGNTDWAVLNRIHDQNPSRIYGTLTADGKVYLINQNGILFGSGSQVNVHALTVSSLSIAEEQFENDLMHFTGDDDCGAVSNHGDIQAGDGGSIYLIGPEVENAGSLDAPSGSVGLVAGNDVEITIPEGSGDRILPYVYVTPGEKGTAENTETGTITADGGLAGMYGRSVNQNGTIRSITAVSNQGRIELHASEEVITGENSVTATPISDSTETFHSSFGLEGGEIHVAGLDEKDDSSISDPNLETATERILHNGEMSAPSGTITMDATDRVYLEAGSLLDVSGEWVSRDAEGNTVSAQLNSVELKNDTAQIDGVLQGETVEILAEEGSSIGDLSAYLDTEMLTAREMATDGGEINLTASEGDIVIRGESDTREAAFIDFSGGGTLVSGGNYNTTMLVSGNQVYDISDAPTDIQYDALANYQENLDETYGILDTYEGLFLGGANSLTTYNSSYIKGDDAGRLLLTAPGIVLDGSLDGSATAGRYQTLTTIPEVMYDNYAVQTAADVKAPRGGELVVGSENAIHTESGVGDSTTDEVVVVSDSSDLPDDFGPDSDLASVVVDGETPYISEFSDDSGSLFCTVLSADTLNQAGLSDLSIHVNTQITVTEEADLILQPGGLRLDDGVDYTTNMALEYIDTAPVRLEFTARAVDFEGSVTLAGGEVDISLADTVTSSEIVLNERAFFADGSLIDVSGETVDNSLVSVDDIRYQTYIDGGSIEVTESTLSGAEVILSQGASLDVSGGYEIGTDGDVDAGSAGSIDLTGDTLVVQADLQGYSLVGETGGTISLHATQISVQEESTLLDEAFGFDDLLPATFSEGFVLAEDQLDQSGFSHITLKSLDDLTIGDDVSLSPSTVKMAEPTVAAADEPIDAQATPEQELVTLPLDQIGSTSIAIQAGITVNSNTQSADSSIDAYKVVLSDSATLEVAPGGSIALSGILVDVGGTVLAPGGTVTLEATGVSNDEVREQTLLLRSESLIDASGANLAVPGSAVEGTDYIAYDVLDGGSVSLAADDGNIILETGATIDVSGSAPVQSVIEQADGTLASQTVASNAGGIAFSYFDDLTLDGDLIGQSHFESAYGGFLSIAKNSLVEGLEISQDRIEKIVESGFDALAFSSLNQLTLEGDMDVQLDRSLVLDAPLITGSGDQTISFQASYISLNNSQSKYGDSGEEESYHALVDEAEVLDGGDASSSLEFSGDSIDVTGALAVSGFAATTLSADGDIRLTDEIYYDDDENFLWKGLFRTPGELTLQAERIYPTTLSTFTLASDTGRITILPGETTSECDTIVSAGGSLILAAEEIDHQGTLAAPMGQILFQGSLQSEASAQTVFLAANSVTTVANGNQVLYGQLDTDTSSWYMEEKPTSLTPKENELQTTVESTPEGTVTILADTTVVQTDALIDLSGGGTIFAYEFIPGTSGLSNPLTEEDTYVIVPGFDTAGEAVQLTGNDILPTGVYTLLSEEYAFLEGAYVIQDLGTHDTFVGSTTVTEEGYAVVTGYSALAGTSFSSSTANLYSVRPAAEVLAESEFSVQELVSEMGGTIDLQGQTVILDGNVVSNAAGGGLAVSGALSAALVAQPSLGIDYDFDTIDIPEYLKETAWILDDSVSGNGVSELQIGSLGITQSVAIKEDVHLEAESILISAGNDASDATLFDDPTITLEQNSTIIATGVDGQVTFNTPDGNFSAASGSEVQSQNILIEASQADFGGQMTADAGALTIQSGTASIVSASYTGEITEGLVLTDTLQGFEGFNHLEIGATDDVAFYGDTNLSLADAENSEAETSVTIDAPTITGTGMDGTTGSSVQAQSIFLLNTTSAASEGTLTGGGSMVLAATDDITIGHGNVVLNGFDAIEMEAGADVVLAGEGALITSGDLEITASRLTTDAYSLEEEEIQVAQFEIGAGEITLRGPETIDATVDGSDIADDIAGSSLTILADVISLENGIIQASGGWVDLTATGGSTETPSISLTGYSRIDVAGNEYAAGGRVTLEATTGSIQIGAESEIDVSAGTQVDAGVLTLSAPQATVSVAGTLIGNADDKAGGSFVLDADQVSDMSTLLDTLSTGGFDEGIDLRLRSGDINLEADDTIRAHEVKLTADGGSVMIGGTIDASGADGGSVEVNAGSTLNLLSGGKILATAYETAESDVDVYLGSGGDVYLNAGEGQLILAADSLIDVSGQSGDGGQIHLRAQQEYASYVDDEGVTLGYIDVRIDVAGTLCGADSVLVEGVRQYVDTEVDGDRIWVYHVNADSFSSEENESIIQDRLFSTMTLAGEGAEELQIVPGIEVITPDSDDPVDLTLSEGWDLTTLDKSQQAGFITLRASGDLVLAESLVDHPTVTVNDWSSLSDQRTVILDSWGFRLTAGADLSSADTMATQPLDTDAETGNLVIEDTKMVYTENNTLRFASGGDTIIEGASSTTYMISDAMVHSIGTFSGDIEGTTVGDLLIAGGGSIQSGTGDIRLSVAGDLYLELYESSGSAIRTTGTAPLIVQGYELSYKDVHDGGDIFVSVGGNLHMGLGDSERIPFYEAPGGDSGHLLYWDNVYWYSDLEGTESVAQWSADFGLIGYNQDATPTAGIATMGGGSIAVTAGGTITGQIGTFKDGDLSVTAHSDLSGYFQVADGTGTITTLGNITSPNKTADNLIYAYSTSLGLFDGTTTVTAVGSIDFGSVFNPTFVDVYDEYTKIWTSQRYLDYGTETEVELNAVTGDLNLAGQFWSGSSLENAANKTLDTYWVLPSTVTLKAGEDIQLGATMMGSITTVEFLLAPSSTGNLEVIAGGTISGLFENIDGSIERAMLRMSDMATEDVYRQSFASDADALNYMNALFEDEKESSTHAGADYLHAEDENSVVIQAGDDIQELALITAKQTAILAGGDISGLYFFGQNIAADDITSIQAGGDIELSSLTFQGVASPDYDSSGFKCAGPGLFWVGAGGDIDLGTTEGIRTLGNTFYSFLSEENSALVVLAGIELETMSEEYMETFFNGIREYGEEYSEKQAEGDLDGADAVVEEAREALIDPLLAESTEGVGNIQMTNASIQAIATQSDLFILANGEINVGLTKIPDPTDPTETELETGIFTSQGGGINIFAVNDINVNESRVMTFLGGDSDIAGTDGDITIWSDEGDINAGRGATTAINMDAPTAVDVYDQDGNYVGRELEWEVPAVGSGIRTLTYDPDGSSGPESVEDYPAGDAYLFAPSGIIDAGEAGIAASNVILGATKVLNAGNIDVAGTSVGVPQTASGPSVGTLVGAGTVSETSKIAEESSAMKSAEERFSDRVASLSDQLVPKWIAVEVVGFEEVESEEEEKNREEAVQ